MRGATVIKSSIDSLYSISIHTPHAGSDRFSVVISSVLMSFQSTLPMRGATHTDPRARANWCEFQSTLPMRGATNKPIKADYRRIISIHTPHAGSDVIKSSIDSLYSISIHTPHAGSDGYCINDVVILNISIHTPHAGSDCEQLLLVVTNLHFNPHSPCGERLFTGHTDPRAQVFQSTLPMRGATEVFRNIHVQNQRFQSTLPMRGAT